MILNHVFVLIPRVKDTQEVAGATWLSQSKSKNSLKSGVMKWRSVSTNAQKKIVQKVRGRITARMFLGIK
jgi:hypothetical protein